MPLPTNPKRVVVTGGSGFLGTRVVECLRTRGWAQEIFVPRSREYDLRTEDGVTRLYRDARPNVVIHLAGIVGGIGMNRANPARFLYDNLVMGAHIMHHAHLNAVDKIVSVGTVCAYPKFTQVPFREADLWNGYPEETNAPYGIAKRVLQVQGQTYRAQYGLNAIYLLPANLFGPRDNFDLETGHVIPMLIRKFVDAQDAAGSSSPVVTVWGDGTPTREFLYVEDCADAIVLATEHYDKAEPVNIGSGHEISIRDLVSLIARLTGYSGEIVWDTSRPNGQPRRCLDTSRAEAEFGFRATIGLEEGLRRTIDWYRTNRTKCCRREY